eukprot:8750727-Karenia_brevis.AAC.1
MPRQEINSQALGSAQLMPDEECFAKEMGWRIACHKARFDRLQHSHSALAKGQPVRSFQHRTQWSAFHDEAGN